MDKPCREQLQLSPILSGLLLRCNFFLNYVTRALDEKYCNVCMCFLPRPHHQLFKELFFYELKHETDCLFNTEHALFWTCSVLLLQCAGQCQRYIYSTLQVDWIIQYAVCAEVKQTVTQTQLASITKCRCHALKTVWIMGVWPWRACKLNNFSLF